jgi:SAM-dependent methyltransferase
MAQANTSSDTKLTTMSAQWYEHLWQAEWMDYSRHGPTRRHVRDIMLALIEPLTFQTVLDVGCGEGSMLEELQQRRPHVQLAGTEVSDTALAYARQKVPSASYYTLDIENEALDQTADLTICCEVLEHLQADEASLANLAQMTRRYMLIVVPQGRMRDFERGDVGHVRNYTRDSLSAKMERVGFEPIAVVEWGFPFFSPLYRDFLERIPGNTVKGRMDWKKRLTAAMLYYVFSFNSWTHGDKLFILGLRRG